MMEEKQTNSDSILWLASSLTNNIIGKVFIWIALLFLANQTFWDPLGKFMDNKFQLETTEQENSYELQKTTLEFIQQDVMDKLNDIFERLDNVENEISDLDERVKVLEDTH